ncbi:MAG: AMP-binding protein, partial [Mycobacterium sp.]|nr:AMP-binding protein [Mycobacterium sp.]
MTETGNATLTTSLSNLTELFLAITEQHPDTPLHLLSPDSGDSATVLTYASLREQALGILGGLREYGHEPGRSVVLVLPRAVDFIPAFWACLLGGYVPCPLAPIQGDRRRWTAHLTHVDTLLGHPLAVSTGAPVAELATVDLASLRAARPAETVWTARPDDAAMHILTSGSTGNAKAVVLTHANVLAAVAAKNGSQRLTAGDVTLNWISFDHVAALLEMHLLPLSVGAEQVHVAPEQVLSEPVRFLQLIDRFRVTATFTPNFLLGQINAACATGLPDGLDLDLSCLRHIISGGEAVVVGTGQRLLELLAPFGLASDALWPAFGMTETCAGSVYSTEFPHGGSGEFASLGRAVDGLSLRVICDDGVEAPTGQSGELQVRGPMVFPRYHNNEAATRAAFTDDGWFRTGDLGRIEDGRLSLVGRSKDSIIVNGVNYFSHELEHALGQL